MPAAFYWNPLAGSDLLASTANNWVDSVGVRSTTVPAATDDLYFTPITVPESTVTSVDRNGKVVVTVIPASTVSPDCKITSEYEFESKVRTYNGVHLLEGYTGTVDFQVSSFVGVLDLRSGKIAQNDAFFTTMGGGQLSVTQSMSWTGGDFNSGIVDSKSGLYVPPPAGKLNLLGGSVSVFDPGEGNTVSLGSFLTITNLNSNSIGTGAGGMLDLIAGGSISLEGVAGILAEGGSLCQAQAKPQAAKFFTTSDNKDINPEGATRVMKFTTGAEMHLYRFNPQVAGLLTYEMGDISMLIDGGAFQVVGEIVAKIEGKVLNFPNSPSILIKTGGLRLENGSSLELTNGLKMEGGSIVTLAALDGPGSVAAVQGVSNIFGDVTITGGDLRMNYNLGQGALGNTNEATLETTFTTLRITGKLDWSGGKFVGYVNSATLGRDTIQVGGDDSACSISKDVTFDLGTSNRDSDLANVPANTTFPIVDSNVAITGTPTLTGTLTKVASLVHSGNDKKIELKKN